jgi:hypothetical protein
MIVARVRRCEERRAFWVGGGAVEYDEINCAALRGNFALMFGK